jgi:hypothetical protein
VSAASFATDSSTVVFRPVAGTAGEVEVDEVVRPATPEVRVRIDKGETVDLVVGDINPLLFSYEAMPPTQEPTPSYAAAKEFLTALTTLKGSLDTVPESRAPVVRAVQEPIITVEGLDVLAYLGNAKNILDRSADAEDLIDATAEQGNGTYQQFLDRVLAWQSEKLHREFAQRSAAAGEILTKELQGRPLSFSINGKFDSTVSTVSRLAERIATEDNTDLSKALTGIPPGQRKEISNRIKLFERVFNLTSELRNTAELLVAFEKAAQDLGRDRRVASITYDPRFIISQKIVVSPSDQFSPFVGAKAKAFQQKRTMAIVFIGQAHSDIHLGISPGIVYSFVRNPEFAAQENSAGDIVVANTENDVEALAAAVALNFTPDRFYGQSVEPFLQVGVVPDSDTPAVFLGVGFKAFNEILLSGGAIYQRVNELGGGLSVGDTLASPNDLVTEEVWETGLFLSIGVGFGD